MISNMFTRKKIGRIPANVFCAMKSGGMIPYPRA